MNEAATTAPARAEARAARWPRIALVAAIVLYLAFSAVYAVSAHEQLSVPAGDGAHYEVAAKQLLTQHFYGYKSNKPNAYISPGYPYFLAAVYGLTGTAEEGRPWGVLLALQLLFGVGTIVLTFLLGRDIFDERAAGIAVLALALYPPMFLIPGLWLTEPLATLTVMGYIVVQLRALKSGSWKLALAAGVLLGCTVLIRPATIAISVAPFLLAAVFGPRKGLVRQAAVLYAAFALVMSPWVIRNVVVLGEPAPFSTHSGDPMLAGVDPYFWQMGSAYRYHGPTYKAYYEYHPEGMSKDEYAKAAIVEDLKTRPLQTVWWFTVGKMDRLYFDEIWASRGRYIGTWAKFVHFPLMVLGLLGAVLSVKLKRLRAPALMVAFATVATLPFVPESRYVFEFVPVLAVMGSVLLVVLWTRGAEVEAEVVADGMPGSGTMDAPQPPEED